MESIKEYGITVSYNEQYISHEQYTENAATLRNIAQRLIQLAKNNHVQYIAVSSRIGSGSFLTACICGNVLEFGVFRPNNGIRQNLTYADMCQINENTLFRMETMAEMCITRSKAISPIHQIWIDLLSTKEKYNTKGFQNILQKATIKQTPIFEYEELGA